MQNHYRWYVPRATLLCLGVLLDDYSDYDGIGGVVGMHP